MKQRIELNYHSGFCHDLHALKDAAELAHKNGIKAMALIEINSVDRLSDFAAECRRVGIEPVFGAEIIHGDREGSFPFSTRILIKNAAGLADICRIIDEVKFDGVCDCVPFECLEKHHSNLLFGSGGASGIIYRLFEFGCEEEIEVYADFYDYFEIENSLCNEEEQKINSKIVELAKRTGKPVVAVTGDRDKICPLFTAKEMLKEFSYLGEDDAYEAVLENPNKVTRLLDDSDSQQSTELKYCSADTNLKNGIDEIVKAEIWC